MINQPMAEMESSGPWYSPVIMATCVAGRRAGRKGLRSYPSVIDHIEHYMSDELEKTNKSNAPSLKRAAYWETNKPDWPEWAYINDENTRSKRPTWARNELDWSAIHAQMSWTGNAGSMNPALTPQIQHMAVGNSASSQVDSANTGWGLILLIIAGLWLLSTSNRAVEEPVRPVERSRSRGLSLTGRRDKYRSK